MTELALLMRPLETANRRPVPWRRMAWVTWCQHRVALISVGTLMAAAALYLWFAGHQLHHAYAAATACQPLNSIACHGLINRFNGMNDFLANGGIFQLFPPLIGVFVGAPVLARELEAGTFRYAWSQGFGRWRWALAKLSLLGIFVAAIAGIFGVLLSWYYGPYYSDGSQAVAFAKELSTSQFSPFGASLFDLHGITFAGWTLAAFAIGSLSGMLVRRVVPAIVTSLGAYGVLAFATAIFLRRHYLTPLITSKANLSDSVWIIGQYGTKNGVIVFTGQPPVSLLVRLCPEVPGPKGTYATTVDTPLGCLIHHGYTIWTTYQPASRFWPFQFIEGGWLLILSALAMTATVWLVRRRAA